MAGPAGGMEGWAKAWGRGPGLSWGEASELYCPLPPPADFVVLLFAFVVLLG